MRIRYILLVTGLLALSVMGHARADLDAGLGALARQDYLAALKEFVEAARAGNARAQYSLAQMYENGQGVTRDYTVALKWYFTAAAQGLDLAQNNLGYIYENGQGVKRNPEYAAGWYQLAAEQGYAIAQYNLGRMYAEGMGIKQDYVQSYVWTALAAAQGDASARGNMRLLALRMDPAQIAQAQKLLAEWLKQHLPRQTPPDLTPQEPPPSVDEAPVIRI